jgi:hypothetical protein
MMMTNPYQSRAFQQRRNYAASSLHFQFSCTQACDFSSSLVPVISRLILGGDSGKSTSPSARVDIHHAPTERWTAIILSNLIEHDLAGYLEFQAIRLTTLNIVHCSCLIVPPNEIPSRQNSSQTGGYHCYRADVAYTIRRTKFRLVDLRSNDTHELPTSIRHADSQPSRRGTPCCAYTFRPDDRKKRL